MRFRVQSVDKDLDRYLAKHRLDWQWMRMSTYIFHPSVCSRSKFHKFSLFSYLYEAVVRTPASTRAFDRHTWGGTEMFNFLKKGEGWSKKKRGERYRRS